MNAQNTPSAADLASFAQMADQTALTPEVLPPTQGGDISQLAVARITADEEAATLAGFALPPPIYAAGTRVIDLGDSNFATERNDIAALPTFETAAQQVIDTVRAEYRRDMQVPLSELRLDAEGRLSREGSTRTGAKLEPRAFGALCQRAGFGVGTRYLRDICDPQLRAFNVNAQMMGLPVEDATEAKIRVRRNGDDWSAFAVMSPSYTSYDVDRFLTDAMPALADSHAEIVYDAEHCTLRADAFWMPDEVVDLAAGDVFKAGVRLRTSDDGKGSVIVEAVLFRNLCLNLIIIGEAEIETVRARHTGDVQRIAARVQQGVESAREKIGHFLGQWGKARKLTVDFEAEIAKVTEGVIKAGAPKSLDERLAKAFALAYAKEPGGTAADVGNAITRAAHEGSFGQSTRDTLEAYGAQYIRETVEVAA